MKTVLLVIAGLLSCHCVYSQQKAPPTEEELQAMIKKIQKQSDSIQNVMKGKKLPADGDKNLATGTPEASIPKGRGNIDVEKIKLPPKDSARIKTIPQRDLTSAELSSYLNNLHNQLKKLLPADAVASANSIAEKLKYPQKIENAAVLAWQNGSIEESVLLITDAVTRSTDENILSNAGAILDMSGLSEKAIPILRTVVRIDPEHAAAHNNLGQAYTTLGMQDSALHYFSRCLSLSPQHPEANNTAGVIELQKGNNAKAQMHFENSIRGSFNVSAYSGLRKLLKDKCRITPLVKPKVKLPEYFNQFKYKLPRQCLNIHEAATRKEEQKAFRQMMSALIMAFQKLEKEAEKDFAQKSPAQFNKEIMNKAMKGESVVRPFQVLGSIMEAEAILDYQKDRDDLKIFNKANRQAYKSLEQEYKDAYEKLLRDSQARDDDNCCGEGDVSCCETGFCAASNELKNKYLPRFAQLNEEWQSRNMLIEKTHLDNLLYWGYFASYNKDDFRVRFYQRVVNFLKVITSIDEIKILEPCKEEEPEVAEENSDSTNTKKAPDCPISVSIRFWVGKLEGDCEKIVFKAGEGIKFRVERNFITRQTTLSLGVGYDLDKAEGKMLGLEGGVDLEGTVSAYITFDKDNVPSDGGLLAQAKLKAGMGFETGQKLKFKEGMSVSASISSGITVDPGPLKPLWDKIKPAPEVPINKNVKLFPQN